MPRDPNLKTGAQYNALERIREDEISRLLTGDFVGKAPAPPGAVRVRVHNAPRRSQGSTFPAQAYPAHPHNFTPLRPVPSAFAPLDRAVRDVAWESRFDLLERRIKPRYAGECRGTPRRPFQNGLVGGLRMRPVQNPYVRLMPADKYILNTFPSRNWDDWDPDRCHVRGSRRRYRIPEDIAPYKDELGEWHPPRVSGRYKADIEKQYNLQSLPWVWANDYYRGKQHYMDRELLGLKRWYKRDYRKAQVAEAMRRMPSLKEEYRKERRDKKRHSWAETLAVEFAGDQQAAPFVRERRFPKM